MTAYYNDIDPVSCDVLEELIKQGLIPDGVVDRRSIKDVTPADLAGFTQAHFFAGVGCWSVAARIAEWPDDLPLWTASAPCQGFSDAGKKKGFHDDRHLWPELFKLVEVCKPPLLAGEQVASPLGRAWYDEVAADLESSDYAVRAIVATPIVVGSCQIRERIWFVARTAGVPAPRFAEPWGQPFSRPAEPEMGCVSYGVAGRTDFLRLAGNSLDPFLAAEALAALKEELDA